MAADKKRNEKSQMPKRGLKGKFILTAKYFGVVLNEAESAPAIIIRATRLMRSHENDWTLVAFFGYPSVSTWWEVCDQEVVLPWAVVGEYQILEKMPKRFYIRSLRASRRGPLTRTVKGRTYVDW